MYGQMDNIVWRITDFACGCIINFKVIKCFYTYSLMTGKETMHGSADQYVMLN